VQCWLVLKQLQLIEMAMHILMFYLPFFNVISKPLEGLILKSVDTNNPSIFPHIFTTEHLKSHCVVLLINNHYTSFGLLFQI